MLINVAFPVDVEKLLDNKPSRNHGQTVIMVFVGFATPKVKLGNKKSVGGSVRK